MAAEENISKLMLSIGKASREAASVLAMSTNEIKNKALHAAAQAIRRHQVFILDENQKDMTLAKKKGLTSTLLDRLALNDQRIESMALGLEAIAQLPDPVGKILNTNKRPNGLEITRISTPIGVIGVIYESRPNVTADAAGLCLKSGNAVILRSGSESFNSAAAILKAIHEGLAEAHLPLSAIQMVPTPVREAVNVMLKMDQYIDVIIPRGGQKLIEFVTQESRIPLFKHLSGLCHTYIHQAADLSMARHCVLNAKMRRTGICGATEVLLIDHTIAHSYLPLILEDLLSAGCEVRGDQQVVKLDARVKLATEVDYCTEFLDAIIAIKVVPHLEGALTHIAQHSTHHTDAIITEDNTAAEKFLKEVDSAIVMHNTSTQFADGGEFGMGAEIGIATGKLHARGPVGIEQLTIFKYLVRGTGQIRT
jgi:glutamate-5-semialdehyde dehydrogenase